MTRKEHKSKTNVSGGKNNKLIVGRKKEMELTLGRKK
jgi:hypothetical protein